MAGLGRRHIAAKKAGDKRAAAEAGLEADPRRSGCRKRWERLRVAQDLAPGLDADRSSPWTPAPIRNALLFRAASMVRRSFDSRPFPPVFAVVHPALRHPDRTLRWLRYAASENRSLLPLSHNVNRHTGRRAYPSKV